MSSDNSRYHGVEAELRIMYNDDPDKEKAGQGLETFPLVGQALGMARLEYWMMSPAERVALIFLLEHMRPKVAIEIGTRFGGSLQAISRFSDRVYSIDVDREVLQHLDGKFSNAEYLIGPSSRMLPPLLGRLQHEQAELGFALVDGDHSAEGVREDIDNLLQFRPTVPFYIVMHDSFNPQCRQGLRQASWSANPYVHAVELDFVAGSVNPAPRYRDQLWGGLALGILLPYERQGRFEITARAEETFRAVATPWRPLVRRAIKRAKRTLPVRMIARTKRFAFGD